MGIEEGELRLGTLGKGKELIKTLFLERKERRGFRKTWEKGIKGGTQTFQGGMFSEGKIKVKINGVGTPPKLTKP